MKETAILVVDDDPFICRAIIGYLQVAGYTATAVGGGQEALEILGAQPFGLVLTDYNMQGMNGTELARQIRSVQPSMPICLVTGAPTEVGAGELERFDGVLEKPFDATELTALVGRLLATSGERQEVPRAPRYDVDWRVDYIPLATPALTGRTLPQHRASLRNLSPDGLSFVADETPACDRFCAFLIYPPEGTGPSLMVGEVRWRRDQEGKTVTGTRSLFWGSDLEKSLAIKQAM